MRSIHELQALIAEAEAELQREQATEQDRHLQALKMRKLHAMLEAAIKQATGES